ncbi:MAG: GAF domain-containing protein, partial [Candidatus Thermoplasmatota archaeon]|nr:GAF domain-containing protein [Candidatus Thermoplasmatota archaeon]
MDEGSSPDERARSPKGTPPPPQGDGILSRMGFTLREDRRAGRDLIYLLAGSLLLFVLLTSLEAPARAVAWTLDHPTYGVLQWGTMALILLGGFVVFSVRRWLDLQEEVQARRASQAALQARSERLDLLVSTQQALVMTRRGLDGLLEEVAQQALVLTGADAVLVQVPREGRLWTRAGAGEAEDLVGGLERLEEGLSASCFQQGTLRAHPDLSTPQDRAWATPDGPAGMGAALACPLTYRGDCFGVLKILSRTPRAFEGTDHKELLLLAGATAAALSHALAFEEQESLLAELTSALRRLRGTNAFFRMLQTVAVAANEA